MEAGMSKMKVVILCGGRGTRLREETEFRPKPMIEIGGRPILWHIMKTYAFYGYTDFVLCTGYKGEMIKEYFLNYEAMNNDFTVKLGSREQIDFHSNHSEKGWSVTIADTGEDAMTGARIKRVEKYIDTEEFMLTYGDGLADINIKDLLEFHHSKNKIGTITGVLPTSRYGEMTADINTGNVAGFSEKPPASELRVSGGFFVFKKKFLDYLNSEDDCVLEKAPLENLAKERNLIMYPHSRFWYCMDTYRDYIHLKDLWTKGKAPWKVWK
jgi:glucose-1-phosphate cytidylyltransferase